MNYLDITKADDLEKKKERIIYRLLEILPGTLSIITLLSAVLLSWLYPIIIAFFIIAFDIYWFLRVVYFSLHQVSSYKKMQNNLKIDWEEKVEGIKEKNWKDIYHLIILPTYEEELEVLRTSFNALKEAKYPKDKMIVVLGIEERGGEKALKIANEIKKEFGNIFFRFLISVHPRGLKEENPGKGSNLSYAANMVKEKIIDELKIPYENIILSSFDIDTKAYPQYFLCLTYNYLTDNNRLLSSYQPIPVYNNNIWDAPSFTRVVSVSGSFWQMIMQEMPEKLVTYSSHSFPFKVFIDVGYPKNIVADDSHVFWKAYFYYRGNYKVVPLYYPVSMDAVMSDTFKKTIVNQYKQQRRWAWGCIEIPYVVFNLFRDSKIRIKDKIKHSFTIIEGFWSWANSALLIFLLGWLPLLLGGERFSFSIISYNLPRLTGLIMNFSMIGIIISAVTAFLVLPPSPLYIKKWKKVSMALQWFLLPVTLIVFGSFPAIEAQIRMMFKKPLGFWVTEKARKKDRGV